MYLNRWHHPDLEAQFFGWLQGFAELLDALITLCSFGFVCSSFELRYCAWRTLRQIKQQRATLEETK
jgi:hypothetical protein